jgi:peptidoglycan/LPS O-acetylase OafA/YrhL
MIVDGQGHDHRAIRVPLGAAIGQNSFAYRADIDGLRAVAVLLVIGFHAFPTAISGGFVGVDVFFVISGFLISSLIARELADKQFSLLTFYARRARRIFPALLVVLVVCLAAGWQLMLPSDYRALGLDAAWSAAFLANIRLYFQAGYFDAASEMKPLLHLWSLSIEEQFYIFWPLLLMLTARRRWMWQGALVVLVGSFACNIVVAAVDRTAAFYLPATRVWELAAGAMLALSPFPARALAYRNVSAWLGLILLAAAVLLIDPDKTFPGWWALMPVLATALLIFGGPAANINRHVLSCRVLVGLGLISYPLYLWHWPMLVFARIVRFGAEPTVIMKLVLIGIAFVLAWLTYRWIELPFRFGQLSPLKPLVASTGLAAAACLALLISRLDGVPSRFPGDVQHLVKDFQTEAIQAYRTGTCFLTDVQSSTALESDCISVVRAEDPFVLLWGDSHAAQLFPGLASMQRHKAFNLAQYTVSGCPPIVTFSSMQRANCVSINNFVMRRIEALKPHTVILAGRWDLYQRGGEWGAIDPAAVRATIDSLVASGVERIVVVGQFPVWTLPPSRIPIRNHQLSMFSGQADRLAELSDVNSAYVDSAAFDAEEKVRRYFTAPNVRVVSPRTTLCSLDACQLYAPGTPPQPIAWDDSHLTVAGSVYFVSKNAEQMLGR